MSYVQLTEAQLYDLGNRGSSYDDLSLKRLYVLHLRHEHGMAIRDIARRMGMKMKLVNKLIAAKPNEYGEIDLD